MKEYNLISGSSCPEVRFEEKGSVVENLTDQILLASWLLTKSKIFLADNL
jgi:hypothetical protein